jgi:hypothetical protein
MNDRLRKSKSGGIKERRWIQVFECHVSSNQW